MPDTPYEFHSDAALLVIRIPLDYVDTLLCVTTGPIVDRETQVDVLFAITRILLRETHVIET
ncbi:MAG: hypothetical protein BWY59_02216 [Verrucomicrobia bacterium ADurb.Bin345]|nr:MAG: hypothetical protein BWY59_02216 [Verrucomicrobia bacterium ADurb.Bin345]